MILILLLALPLIAAALSAVLPMRRAAQTATAVSALATLFLAIVVALRVSAGSVVSSSSRGTSLSATPGFLAADGLSALIVVLVALIGATAAIYSWGYMERTCAEHPGRLRIYYANYNVFIFAMLAIPLTAEPTLVWIFVELTTLSSALLVSFENTREALEAAWKYVTLSLMGAGIALLGFLMLFAALEAAGSATYSWTGLLAAAPRMPAPLIATAFLLILVGFGTKVGLVPLHTWLPDAHSQAPSPICALLSGIETTSVLYVILRLLPILRASPAAVVAQWIPIFGLVSVGVAAFLLLQVRDYKRLFAFSTVEHMGIILVAAGLGSGAARYAALYQVLCHTITKSFCFFAAGSAVLTVETREIASVRGLIRESRAAAASLLLGGLAIGGAPPLAVFLSEFSILKAGFAAGQYVVMALLALFIAVAFFGILLHINRMVFGRAREPEAVLAFPGAQSLPRTAAALHSAKAPPLPRTCLAMLLVVGALVVLLGVYLPSPIDHLLRLASGASSR
jgi:hydrogenase-4 component F